MQTQNAHLKPLNRGPIPMGAAIRRRPSIAGQSVFIALAVLFLLAFLGAVFITVIARNIAQSGRSTQTLNADYYAQAGINYANEMLETSPQGADWRPPLQFLLSANAVNKMNAQQLALYFGKAAPGATIGTYNPASTAYEAAGGLPPVQVVDNRTDPDAVWLADGFTRYNVGDGRFLIRISYVFDPDSGSPTASGSVASAVAKYIRIDSIGRYGTVDPTDPTTFVNQPPTRLRAEMTAYKPIGLVDYARFITNKDNRTDTANIGVPSINTEAGLASNPYSSAYPAVQIFANTAGAPIGGLSTTLVTPNVLDFNPANLPGSIAPRPYPIITTLGSPSGYNAYGPGSNFALGGGSFRANCNVRFFGLNIDYLNPAIGDDIEVAGQILLDRYNSKQNTPNADVRQNQQAQFDVVSQTTGAANPNLFTLYPSDDTNFSTDSGVVRDGSTSPDAQGYARSVQRLDPPSLDTSDPASGLTRYRTLTNRGAGLPVVNAGNPGTVYVNNTSDIQSESQKISGGYTLRDEWLNKGGNGANWKGDFYNPPGVVIRFGPIPNPTPPTSGTAQPYLQLSNGEPAWGITLTRSDTDANGNPIFWPTRTGGIGSSQTMYIVYAPLSVNVPGGESPVPPSVNNDPGYPYFFMNAENAPGATDTAGSNPIVDPDNDIVIYAEGNVRVSGMVSDPNTTNGNIYFQHVTIVTNGVGYIDGSILKGGPGYTVPTSSGAPTGDYISESSAALLAESYICVNTTQFMAGPPNFSASTAGGLGESTASPFTVNFSESSQALTEPVLLVPAVDTNGAATASPLNLYISQYSAGATNTFAQGNVSIAGMNAANTWDIWTTVAYAAGPPPAGLPEAGTPYGGQTATPYSDQTTVSLDGNDFKDNGGTGAGFPGFGAVAAGESPIQNYLVTFSMATASANDWNMEHAGIFPANARVEAILYAQNNSFFVIPGSWFNSNTNDTLLNFTGTGSPRSNVNGGSSDNDPNFQRFPFYGQPVDLQISIFGTVAENLPANLGDQAAWEQKWGWIPIYHGSLYPGNPATATVPNGETSPVRDPNYATNVPQVGLNMSYDPADGFDMITQNGNLQYIRLDQYGRPLPVTPDLPVSTDLLYSGQSQTASLLP